jgi:hypothetical protein
MQLISLPLTPVRVLQGLLFQPCLTTHSQNYQREVFEHQLFVHAFGHLFGV